MLTLTHDVENIIIHRPNQRRLGRSSSRRRVFVDDRAVALFLRPLRDKILAAAVVIAAAS